MLSNTRHIHTCTEQEKQRAKVFPHQEVGYDFHVKIINHRQGQRKIYRASSVSFTKRGRYLWNTYGFWSMESKDKTK